MNRMLRSTRVPRPHANSANNRRPTKRGITGLAAAVLLSGGVGLAGLGLAAGTAHANPLGPYTWCPGKGLSPDDAAVENDWGADKGDIKWNWHVCHTFYIYARPGNVGADDIWEGNDPPPPPPPPVNTNPCYPGCL